MGCPTVVGQRPGIVKYISQYIWWCTINVISELPYQNNSMSIEGLLPHLITCTRTNNRPYIPFFSTLSSPAIFELNLDLVAAIQLAQIIAKQATYNGQIKIYNLALESSLMPHPPQNAVLVVQQHAMCWGNRIVATLLSHPLNKLV